MAEDILLRMKAQVVRTDPDPMRTVVEIDAGEFYECLNEVIRLRASLEAIAERSTVFSSVTQLQRLAAANIMPPGEGI